MIWHFLVPYLSLGATILITTAIIDPTARPLIWRHWLAAPAFILLWPYALILGARERRGPPR